MGATRAQITSLRGSTTYTGESPGIEEGSRACSKGRAILGEGFSLSKLEKIRIHSLHFTLFPSRALVQIKSEVRAAVGEDQSNLVEEIPQKTPRQINFTCSLQVQNANARLIAANIKNAAKSTIS